MQFSHNAARGNSFARKRRLHLSLALRLIVGAFMWQGCGYTCVYPVDSIGNNLSVDVEGWSGRIGPSDAEGLFSLGYVTVDSYSDVLEEEGEYVYNQVIDILAPVPEGRMRLRLSADLESLEAGPHLFDEQGLLEHRMSALGYASQGDGDWLFESQAESITLTLEDLENGKRRVYLEARWTIPAFESEVAFGPDSGGDSEPSILSASFTYQSNR